MQEKERDFLLKSAYTDELTQIHNRRYCMEYMTRVKEMENPDYTDFCFDLNNLKTTNDTYGHAQGDILIRSAAEVIVNAFEPHGIVARMGGHSLIVNPDKDLRTLATELYQGKSEKDTNIAFLAAAVIVKFLNDEDCIKWLEEQVTDKKILLPKVSAERMKAVTEAAAYVVWDEKEHGYVL